MWSLQSFRRMALNKIATAMLSAVYLLSSASISSLDRMRLDTSSWATSYGVYSRPLSYSFEVVVDIIRYCGNVQTLRQI